MLFSSDVFLVKCKDPTLLRATKYNTEPAPGRALFRRNDQLTDDHQRKIKSSLDCLAMHLFR